MWLPAPGVSWELPTLIKSFQRAVREEKSILCLVGGKRYRQIVQTYLPLSRIRSDSQIKNKILGPNHTITSVSVMITVTF